MASNRNEGRGVADEFGNIRNIQEVPVEANQGEVGEAKLSEAPDRDREPPV